MKRTIVIVALVLSGACGGTNPNPSVTPQAKVAHYGSDIAQGITTLQQTVTQVRSTCAACADATDKITDADQQAVTAATKLSSALKAYDAATTLTAKNVAASDVQASVADITKLLATAFNVKVENPMASQIATLVSNVLSLTASVSAEVAKGLTVGGQ